MNAASLGEPKKTCGALNALLVDDDLDFLDEGGDLRCRVLNCGRSNQLSSSSITLGSLSTSRCGDLILVLDSSLVGELLRSVLKTNLILSGEKVRPEPPGVCSFA